MRPRKKHGFRPSVDREIVEIVLVLRATAHREEFPLGAAESKANPRFLEQEIHLKNGRYLLVEGVYSHETTVFEAHVDHCRGVTLKAREGGRASSTGGLSGHKAHEIHRMAPIMKQPFPVDHSQ